MVFRGRKFTNAHVVPYNPYLSRKYNTHINVEVVVTVKVIKYLYAYIHKGYDHIRSELKNVLNEM